VFERNPATILFKSEYYALFELGFFGNKAVTWRSYDEIIGSGWEGKVCIRSKRGIDRKKVIYDLPLKQLPEVIARWKREGLRAEDMTFNQSFDNDSILIQAEVMQFPFSEGAANMASNLEMRYSFVTKPTNKAFEEDSRYARGLKARGLLSVMDAGSSENLEELFKIFPNSVVELGVYATPVGNQRMNTIFWEVRNY